MEDNYPRMLDVQAQSKDRGGVQEEAIASTPMGHENTNYKNDVSI